MARHLLMAMKTIQLENQPIGEEPSGSSAPGVPASTSRRRRLYELLDGRRATTALGRIINHGMVALIAANVAAVILESQTAPGPAVARGFHLFEIASVVIFTIEYLARLWIAPEANREAGRSAARARLRHATSPLALIDLLAILPFYLSLIFAIDLRYLRAFRLLRLLKLSRYFDGLHVFLKVIRAEAGAISAALLTMFVLVIISACLMFSLENAAQPEAFETIVDAIWWAVVTLTTVGYGDITPATVGGKILAIGIMLMGVATFALPAGIMAARFSEELQERREKLRLEVVEALSDGVIDAEEQVELDRLQVELGLSDETLRRLVELHNGGVTSFRFCPHCGERIEASNPR